MKKRITFILLIKVSLVFSQPPKLYIQLVSHNEPNDNLQQPLNYGRAKNHVLQLAAIVDAKNAKWNLQTSDGFVMGARQDQISTSGNIFKTLASPPYADNIEIDPRSKNLTGRNIADQWYLLDSLGANPTKTVGGFIYYVCPPNSSSLIDWWQYNDSITGMVHGNKVKFNLLSGAGSLDPHCNDLNDFGVFKPDTTTNFYTHNPNRNLWCIGTGCAPLLDSMDDEQAIIDLIQGQVDSIQKGLWPANKFYVTRIMTNQREYGPMLFQKVSKIIDSLNLIPSTQLQWATITEAFAAFQSWRTTTSIDYSQWRCGQPINTFATEILPIAPEIFPNPTKGMVSIKFKDSDPHLLVLYNLFGQQVLSQKIQHNGYLDLTEFKTGVYFLRIDQTRDQLLVKE